MASRRPADGKLSSRTNYDENTQRGLKDPSPELLEDLCSRFILNIPSEELESFERLLFSIEQAHWFYEDNTRDEDKSLRSLNLREFIALVFQNCVCLRPYSHNLDIIYKNFTSYKFRVPVFGAILLDRALRKCLLVKGYSSSSSWGFPKGKKNKNELDHICAIREVYEEVGLDLTSILNQSEFIELLVGEQKTKLFIVPGLDENKKFQPKTRNEISEIAWHVIDDFPVNKSQPFQSVGQNRTPKSKYFMVMQFLTPLKTWIRKHVQENKNKYPSYSVFPGFHSVWSIKSSSEPNSNSNSNLNSNPYPTQQKAFETTPDQQNSLSFDWPLRKGQNNTVSSHPNLNSLPSSAIQQRSKNANFLTSSLSSFRFDYDDILSHFDSS